MPLRNLTILAVGCGLLLAAGVALAQDDGGGDRQTRRAETLAPAVARELTAAYDKLENEQVQAALDALNGLLASRGDAMKDFDLASVLQIRGSAYARLDRYDQALADFQRALELGALPAEQNTQLRFNIAQLSFQAENYAAAVRYLRQWLDAVDQPKANAYYMLAAAYYYQDDFGAARPHIERALRLAEQPDKQYFDLANIIYAKLDQGRERARLLERIVVHWPSEASYWKQLAAIYKDLGESRKALATLEIAYRNGLIEAARDVRSLVQLYSVHDNPHRGAQLLKKEMQAGTIARNVDNLELLSQLWSQAREHDKAIPVLREAARRAESGALSYRLGQTLLADEQNAAAEKALEAALNKGGLASAKRADAWLLLGTARFNQAGPGDTAKRAEADQAFTSAEQFPATRKQASGWRRYLSAINQTEQRQAALEAQQDEKLAEAARARELTACRAQRLSGAELSDKCQTLLDETEALTNKPGSDKAYTGEGSGAAVGASKETDAVTNEQDNSQDADDATAGETSGGNGGD